MVRGVPDPIITAFTATIIFSEVVDGFKTGDITASNATLGAINGSGTTYMVLVTPTTASDILTLQVAAGVAEDAAGNQNSASEAISTVDTTLLAVCAHYRLFTIYYITAPSLCP